MSCKVPIRPRLLPTLLTALLALTAIALPALASDWKQLRAEGQIGERYDGYLEARVATAAGEAASVNAARRELYQRRAAETGAPVEQVGRVYFLENLDQLPPGTWLRMEDGSWAQN